MRYLLSTCMPLTILNQREAPMPKAAQVYGHVPHYLRSTNTRSAHDLHVCLKTSLAIDSFTIIYISADPFLILLILFEVA